MDFREAIDDLCEKVGHEDVATALGVSVQTVRQARMADDAKSHRTPPADWQSAVISLAEARLDHYKKLITSVRNEEAGRA